MLRTMAALGAEDEAALGADWFGESLDTPKIYFGMFFETAFGLADGFWCARTHARLCTRTRRSQARPRARMRTRAPECTHTRAQARTRAAMRARRVGVSQCAQAALASDRTSAQPI